MEAHGRGYLLTIHGVPVVRCGKCRTSYEMTEYGPLNLDSIYVAVITALEFTSPKTMGSPHDVLLCCRHCGMKLPVSLDTKRAVYSASTKLGLTGWTISIEYTGASYSCVRCLQKHLHLPSSMYHNIRDSLTRAAQLYVKP